MKGFRLYEEGDILRMGRICISVKWREHGNHRGRKVQENLVIGEWSCLVDRHIQRDEMEKKVSAKS